MNIVGMKTDIVSVYPEMYFSRKDLEKLEKHNLYFYDGVKNKVDLNDIDIIYKSNNLILLVDPSYLKYGWDTFPNSFINKMKGLKGLCLDTNSYSYVDIDYCKKKGIMVTNAPGTSTNAVAQFNIFMMNSLLRKIPLIIKNDWTIDYSKHIGSETLGLTAGILGLGKIGNRVAVLCEKLGMTVQFYNRSKKDVVYERVGLDKLFVTSDVIFNTITYNDGTKDLVDKRYINKMRKEAVLISTSKPVYDHDLVLKMVAKGKLGGYAFESTDKKILDFKGNVMVFPEMAFYTQNTMKNIANELTKCVMSIINNDSVGVYNALC